MCLLRRIMLSMHSTLEQSFRREVLDKEIKNRATTNYMLKVLSGVFTQIEANSTRLSIENKDALTLRQNVGMVFQPFRLIPHMVLKNVMYAPLNVKRCFRMRRGEGMEVLTKWVYSRCLSSKLSGRPKAAGSERTFLTVSQI